MKNLIKTSICATSVFVVLTILQNLYGQQKAETTPQYVLRAQRYELTDEHGQVRSSISALPRGYPGLDISFYDGETTPAATASIMTTKDGIIIGISGPKGTAKAGLVITAKGQAFIEIAETQGQNRASFGIDEDSVPYVSLKDSKGKPVKN